MAALSKSTTPRNACRSPVMCAGHARHTATQSGRRVRSVRSSALTVCTDGGQPPQLLEAIRMAVPPRLLHPKTACPKQPLWHDLAGWSRCFGKKSSCRRRRLLLLLCLLQHLYLQSYLRPCLHPCLQLLQTLQSFFHRRLHHPWCHFLWCHPISVTTRLSSTAMHMPIINTTILTPSTIAINIISNTVTNNIITTHTPTTITTLLTFTMNH